MDIWTTVTIICSNILMLFIGFMLGDEYHHEEVVIQEENSFDRHVQSALWVSRRTLA